MIINEKMFWDSVGFLEGLSTGLRCSLKRSLTMFLFRAVVALYQVNEVLRVTVHVMSDRSIWFHL